MKFVHAGIRMQQESGTKQEAHRHLTTSCNICTYRGLKLDCDACPIIEAHNLTVEIINDLNTMRKEGVK